MRSIALDVHRDFCEVAIKDESRLRLAGRVRSSVSELERASVAGFKRGLLAVPAAAPHRADGMDDDGRLQPAGSRDLRLACLAAAQGAAFLEHRGTGGAVDRAVDAAATAQAGVGRVDDGVGLLVGGDIAAVDGYRAHAGTVMQRMFPARA